MTAPMLGTPRMRTAGEEVTLMTKKQYLEKKRDLLDEALRRLSDVEEILDHLEQLDVFNSPAPDPDALAVGDLVGDAYETAEHLRDAVRDAAERA